MRVDYHGAFAVEYARLSGVGARMTKIEPKPMEPSRVAQLYAVAEMADGAWPTLTLSAEDLAELLADRDYRIAEAKRWRARCPVTAEDVERVGVTWDRALDWCEAQGFIPCDLDSDTRDGDGMVRLRRPGESCGAVFEKLNDGGARFAQSVAYSCNSMSKLIARPAFAILDEMAAMEPGW